MISATVRGLFRCGLFLIFVMLPGASPAQQESVPLDLSELLQKSVGFSMHDLKNTLPKGRPVAMTLPAYKRGQISVAGAELLRVPINFFLDRFRQIPTLKRGKKVLQIHEFGTPPNKGDLQSLALTQDDLQELSKCHPGRCNLKLSSGMMDDFHKQNLNSASSADDAFREAILHYLDRYLKRGNSEMISYADKDPVIHSADAFEVLLQQADWLRQAAPPLYECLKSFSGAPCPQIDSFVYWSNVKFGLKPVFTVTQALIYRTNRAGQPWVFVALKQLYADHYFTGSLGLAVLVGQSAQAAGPALWILYLDHSSTDTLRGWLGSLERTIVDRKSRDAMRNTLLALKRNLESKYASSKTSSKP